MWLTRVVQVELLQLMFFIDDLVLVMNYIECCKKFFLYTYSYSYTYIERTIITIAVKWERISSQHVDFLGCFYFPLLVRSLNAKYGPDRYRRDKSVKFGTELP